MIVAVPPEIPETSPELSTVAMLMSDDVQAFVVAGVADPVSCVVEPSQTVKIPVTTGKEFIVTLTVA